eukprot:15107729-Heterocapsa_arctica.AAC.1
MRELRAARLGGPLEGTGTQGQGGMLLSGAILLEAPPGGYGGPGDYRRRGVRREETDIPCEERPSVIPR